MNTKKKNRKRVELPYGTYSELARRIKANGGSPSTASGVWRAIHQSEDPAIIAMAVEYINERKQAQQQKDQAKQSLANAIAS